MFQCSHNVHTLLWHCSFNSTQDRQTSGLNNAHHYVNLMWTLDLSLVWHAFLSYGYSLVLHCASLLRTIFESLARAHERVHVQNVSDFPQTELYSEINSHFLLNEHGDPPIFWGVIVLRTNSLIKSIFEEETKFCMKIVRILTRNQ